MRTDAAVIELFHRQNGFGTIQIGTINSLQFSFQHKRISVQFNFGAIPRH